MNEYTRRGFLRRVGLDSARLGLVALGAGGGAIGAGKGARFLVNKFNLERAVDEFYDVAYNTIEEFRGEANRKLTASVNELRTYVSDTESKRNALAKYWEKFGAIGSVKVEELDQILKNAERFVMEDGFTERMTMLRDRYATKIIDADKALQLNALQRFNESFSKLVKGEEKGSREALDNYRLKLGSLIKVYDLNRDNKVAQADLISEDAGYFAKAQEEVLRIADERLRDRNINAEEREFFKGLREFKQRDPSGKTLADYILKTEGYLQAIEATDSLARFGKEIVRVTGDIKSLQALLEEGNQVKRTLREMSTNDIEKIRSTTESYISRMELEKKRLERSGYSIDYDMNPKLTAARDAITRRIGQMKDLFVTGAEITGGIASGALVGWLAYRFGPKKGGVREVKKLEKKLDELDEERKKLLGQNEKLADMNSKLDAENIVLKGREKKEGEAL